MNSQTYQLIKTHFSKYGEISWATKSKINELLKYKLSPIDDGFIAPDMPPSKLEEKLPLIRSKDLMKVLQFVLLSPLFSDQLKEMMKDEFFLACAIDQGKRISLDARNSLLSSIGNQSADYIDELNRIMALSGSQSLKNHFSKYKFTIDRSLLKRCFRTSNGTWYYRAEVICLAKQLRNQLYDEQNKKSKLKNLSTDIAKFINDLFFIKHRIRPSFTPELIYQFFYK